MAFRIFNGRGNGTILRMLMKLYLFGSSVSGWRCFVGTLTLGACFHWYEKVMLMFVVFSFVSKRL